MLKLSSTELVFGQIFLTFRIDFFDFRGFSHHFVASSGINHFQNSDIFDARRSFEPCFKGSTVAGASKKTTFEKVVYFRGVHLTRVLATRLTRIPEKT